MCVKAKAKTAVKAVAENKEEKIVAKKSFRLRAIAKVKDFWAKQSKKSKAWRIGMDALLIAIMCGFVIACLFGSQYIIAGGVLLLVNVFGLEITDYNVAQSAMHIISCVLAVLMIVFIPKIFLNVGTSRNELGLRDLLTWQDIGLAVVGFVVAMLAGTLLSAVVSMVFPGFDSEQPQEIGYENVQGGLPLLMVFISLVIAAPIMEEILFRGWLYGKMRSRMIAIPAILIDAALFGAAHGQLNVAITVGAMAAVMCFVRELTGTIWSGMLIHMMKNGLAFYLLFVVGVV